MLSFSCMPCSPTKTKVDKESTIFELKTIDPSFTSFNMAKGSFIEKNSSISMF